MPVAIIIGLEYIINHISIMILDLYKAYTYFSSLGFTIYLITDIVQPIISDSIKSIVSDDLDNKKISDGIYDFIKNFESIKSDTIRSAADLISSVQNIIFAEDDKEIAVYYSGHAKLGGLVMPNEDITSIISIRDIILYRLSSDAYVIFIMDCCNPQGGLLPYRLSGNSSNNNQQEFVLVKPYRFDTVVEKNVILLASTTDNEKSYAVKYGSLFSRYLFSNLMDMAQGNVIACRSISNLLYKISNDIKLHHPQQQQTPCAYVSYPIDKMIWAWLYGSPISISAGLIDNTIIVKHL